MIQFSSPLDPCNIIQHPDIPLLFWRLVDTMVKGGWTFGAGMMKESIYGCILRCGSTGKWSTDPVDNENRSWIGSKKVRVGDSCMPHPESNENNLFSCPPEGGFPGSGWKFVVGLDFSRKCTIFGGQGSDSGSYSQQLICGCCQTLEEEVWPALLRSLPHRA